MPLQYCLYAKISNFILHRLRYLFEQSTRVPVLVMTMHRTLVHFKLRRKILIVVDIIEINDDFVRISLIIVDDVLGKIFFNRLSQNELLMTST